MERVTLRRESGAARPCFRRSSALDRFPAHGSRARTRPTTRANAAHPRVWLAAVALLAIAAPGARARAEERYVPTTRGWVTIQERGAGKDATLDVALLDAKRARVAAFPPLVGPIFVSNLNRQILSCESNARRETRGTVVHAFTGAEVFRFAHVGFLRACGLVADGRVYWLHYSVMREEQPWNVLVALDRAGVVVVREEFREAKTLAFTFEGGRFTLPVPAAERPD
jgi:hypothetical protein